MKTFVLPVAITVALLTGCGEKNSTKSTAATTNAEPNYTTGNPVTAPVDYMGAVVDAKKHSEKVIDVAYINQAIQLFQASEGRLPKDLAELVPGYLGKIPQAPFGQKIVYDAATGTVKVVKE